MHYTWGGKGPRKYSIKIRIPITDIALYPSKLQCYVYQIIHTS